MSRASAWVLTLDGHRAAVGVREQVHLMLDPEAAELASMPAHCRHVIFWNNRCVPVMDLGRWLDPGATASAAGANRHLGIYAYQHGAGAPVEFGALWLTRPPQRVEVDDAAASHLPDARWRSIATACFEDGAGAVPILDLTRIFSGALAG